MYFEGVFLTLVCTCALIGNICMWIIICKSRELKTITNAFILGLTTADLLVAVANMPVTILTIFYGEWILSEEACVIFGYLNMFTLVLSVMSLCNISLNRYVMVCKPIHFKTIYTKRNAVLMISLCVFVSLVLSSPPLFGWAEYSYIKDQSFCFCDWAKSPSYAFFMISCCFGIPFAVMTICNVIIYRTVRASKKRVTAAASKVRIVVPVNSKVQLELETSTVSSTQNDKSALCHSNQRNSSKQSAIHNLSTIDDVKVEVSSADKSQTAQKSKPTRRSVHNQKDHKRSEEIRLALALAIVVIMFVVCWLPFCISMLIGIFNPDIVNASFHMWTLLIGYSNSCMNPVIYGAMNRQFGEGFKDIFCLFCKR